MNGAPGAMSPAPESGTFEGWAILELMGHRRLGGYVREVTLAGAGMLRIDVPGDDDEAARLYPGASSKPAPTSGATQFVSPQSLYALTPCTEATARAVARACRVEPVQRWELPSAPARRQLTQPERELKGECEEQDREATEPGLDLDDREPELG